jgi:hypothetical protein
VLLEEPRSLSGPEAALLERLVEHTALPELRQQLKTARVIGLCSCGCPSVELATDGPAVQPEAMETYNAPESTRDDYIGVSAIGRNRNGREIDVTLHAVFGLINELEIWTGDPKATRTDIPVPETLRF